MTNPATVTMSIRLLANAPLSCPTDQTTSQRNKIWIGRSGGVFAQPSGQLYHDVTTSYHLSGLSHLDNFIVTRKSCPLTGTLQKRMPTLTQTATPHTTGPSGLIIDGLLQKEHDKKTSN